MQGSKQHFGLRLGPSLAILGPVKVFGSFEGKLGYREVMLKLSQTLLY